MLALSSLQAMLGAEQGRSMASPSQSGSTAPALHTGGAQILYMSQPNPGLWEKSTTGRGAPRPYNLWTVTGKLLYPQRYVCLTMI
jgi:hypothetical protein